MKSTTKLNTKAWLLKVGDLVTTEFIDDEDYIVREITAIYPANTGSKYQVHADGGDNCSLCGRKGTDISGIDAAWFLPVSEK